MNKQDNLSAGSPAIHTHLTIVQGVIQRMADNSRSCKLWCVTLVSAVLFFTVRTESPEHALVALIPLAALLSLDAYYLALERGFRDSYDSFVQKLHNNNATLPDLFTVVPSPPSSLRRLPGRLLSPSIYVFYIPLATTLLVVWYLAWA